MYTHAHIIFAPVALVSLECDTLEVSESVETLEVCAVLNVGQLAFNLTLQLIATCGDACGKSRTIECGSSIAIDESLCFNYVHFGKLGDKYSPHAFH